jgi:hypothetical protein
MRNALDCFGPAGLAMTKDVKRGDKQGPRLFLTADDHGGEAAGGLALVLNASVAAIAANTTAAITAATLR